MIYGFRVLLIRLGKILPFLITFLVFISYTESFYAIATNSLAEFDGEVVLYKPISWFIASHFEYNIYVVGLLGIISIAIETCIWNKLALVYLLFQLLEKELLLMVALEVWQSYVVIVMNMLLSLFLTFKGLKSANNL